MPRVLRLLSLILSATLLGSCGGGSDGSSPLPSPPAAPPAVAAISVSLGASQLEVSATTTAVAELRSATGAVLSGRSITWSSSNPSAAAVTSTGTVTALSLGSAVITAASEGRAGSAVVTVVPVPVASLSVSIAQSTVFAGSSTTATVVLRSASGETLSGRPVSWTSSNTSVATIGTTGVISSLAPGTTTITASSEGRTGSASLSVVPIPVATIAVALSSSSVPVGTTVAATASVLGPGGEPLTGRAIAWSSSNATVATITEAGVITALSPGSTTIVGASEGRSGSAQLSVLPAPVASVVVTLSARTLQIGQSAVGQAAARDAAGNVLSGRSVSWSSSNPLVASVTPAGTVTAVAPGAADIGATIEGQVGSAAVQVTSVGVASVSLSPTGLNMLVGDVRLVVATVRDAAGAILTGRSVQWFSSDVTVIDGAVRGDTALVTALRPGSAVISVEVEGRRASTGVVVQGAAVNVCSQIAGASIVANDGRFLGRFTGRFDAESVLNQFGEYGSRFAANSTNNEFGTYGSQFSSLSARNPFTSTPPRIVRNNSFLAFYTVNETLSPRVSPAFALTCNFP